jgi:uncharacterized RDD family membrane protein YckC
MSRVIRVALLPFVLAWSLLRLLFWPVVVIGLAWWLIPDGSVWFPIVAGGALLYLGGAWIAFRAGARGMLRSLDRGPVHIDDRRSRRGKW